MFPVITGLIALLVICRVVWPLRCPRATRWILAALVLLVSQHFLVTRTFFGSMASPEIPGRMLMLLGWGFGAILLAACLVLLVDLLGVLAYPLRRTLGRRLLSAPRLRGGIAVLAMALAAVGVWEAVRVPDVRTVELALPRWPAALDGYRVVQLTDLHASRLLQRPWMEAVVAKTNARAPDLILLTGDMADGTVAARRDDVAPLAALRARHGVYAVPGNHDYYADYRQWLEHFDALGLRMLLNAHQTVDTGAARAVLAGITDPASAGFGLPLPDIEAAVAGAPADAPVILLSHRPLDPARHARAGADLQLSGHTHGGQVLGLHWLTRWANGGHVSGLYDVDGMRLYVSNGTGLWNGFPIRLGKRSEITEFVLRASPGRS